MFRLVLSLIIVLASLSSVFSRVGVAGEFSAAARPQQGVIQDDAPQTAAPLVKAPASAVSTKSLSLDGTGDYVQIPHDPALGLDGASAVTIEAWVRRADDSRCEAIISKDFQSAYWLGFCSGPIRFFSGGSGTSQDGNTDILTGVWTHIAVVWESGGQRKYYVNGELDYTGSADVGPAANAYSVFIGADPGPDPLANEFSGNIAEVRLWNVARGQDDIRRTMHVTLDEARPGLVSTWRLGDDLNDSIGAHDGVAVGDADLAVTDPAVSLQPARVPVDGNFNTLAATRSGAATAYVPNLDRALLIGGAKGGVHSDNVDALDASTGNVSSLATLPTPLTLASAVHVPSNDTVYVFGGWSSSLGGAADSIYALNPITGALRTLGATVPISAYEAAAVYHAGLDKVYLLGGMGSSGAFTDISVFDPATETITPANFGLPFGRYGMAAAYSPASDKIYYFGGIETAPTNTIFEIALDEDGLNGTLTQLTTTLPSSSSRFNAVRDPATQFIYLLGGDDQDRVLAFDPLTGQLWQTPIEMENARIRSSAVYSPRNRQALLVGGYWDGSQSNVWRIPLGDGPAISLGRWDFPTPVGAEAQAIDGDETRVLIGTLGDGAWRYEDDGSRYHYTAGILGSVNGIVPDVRYNALNDHSWLATTDAGGQVDVDGSITVYDNTVLDTDSVEAVYVDPGYSSIYSAPYFGTWDEGLKRKTWRNGWMWTTNFAGENVTAITRRDAGDIWVISNGRLKQLTFNPLAETDYGADQCNLLSPEDLAFGPNGDWWLVSSHVSVRAVTAQDHDLPQSLSSGTGEFKPGLYRAPGGNGVCRILAADIPSEQNHLEPFIGTLGTAVDVDSDGRVWVSLKSYFYESGGLVAYEVVGAAPGTLYTAEYNWLNAPLGGLGVTFSGEDVESGFTAVGAADERVWAGKDDGRLVTLAQRWQQLDESNDLDQKVIEGIWTARGRAFMATSDSLHVLMPDGQTWDNRNGLKVWDVLGDSQGRTWVGTNTGIRLYTRNGWDYVSTAEGVRPAYAIYALAEDQAGRVWIGGLHGLTLFDRDRFVFTLTDANSDLPDEKIRTLLSDRDDRLWVGTDVGLARLDGSDWTVFTTTHGLPSDAIFDLAQTGAGEIAVSTAGGLAFYDGGSFITETLPLPDANLPLTVDEMGRLWAGSAVRAASGWQGYYWTNSGLRSSEISDNAADGAERVWFSHAPDTGVSVRGSTLPPLPDVVPTLTGISPDHGSAGQTITITGSGFGSRIADLDVTVGQSPVDIVSLSDTEMTVQLNDHNRSGDVSVNLGGRRVSLTDAFCADPVLADFDPTGGNDGVMVHIRGSNFDPGARVSLGGAPRASKFTDPTHLRLDIRPEDGTGPVQVSNLCGASHATSSSVEFRRIVLNLETIVLNQGILGTGLVADRTTMVQHYVSQSVARRGTDQLEIDTIELSFTEAGSAPLVYTIPYTGVIPELLGPPSGAARADTNMSVNTSVRPQIEGSSAPDAEVQVDAVLKHRGQIVAQDSRAARFRPNYSMRVLLVPIMNNNYVYEDVNNLKENVNAGLNHLRDRIMPTGQVEIYWSPLVYTVDSVLIGENNVEIDLGSITQLYDASHSMDQARRWWNAYKDPDVLIAFGVVDDSAISANDVDGQAFWPDMSQIINLLALDVLDTLCDIGNTLVQIFSFGLLGSDDGCHLEIPLYVGWARGNATSGGDQTQYSELYAHEFGHIMGLVKPTAFNGSWSDNLSHSVNDELDNGTCSSTGTTFNWNKSLYAQPGVSEPVVDPIGMTQFAAANDGNAHTVRGKAIMSYACERNNDNVFFEPLDLPSFFFEYGAASVRNYIDYLNPGDRRAARSTTSVSQANDGPPLPLPVSGERLYVSGVITRTGDSGRLQNVEVLDEQAPLDAGYVTGYWLVQLDGAGGELSRRGVFPVFTSVGYGSSGADHAVESDSGFFAATIQRQEGVARVELRHDDTLLDAIEAGGAAPSVSVSSPAGGVYDSGTINVAWTASDADGDPLDITILYSADGALSWMPVAFSSGSGSVEVAVAQLAGSSDARFQVVASDGFNTGSVTSAAFTVSDQPPRPYVGSPISASTLLEGDIVILSGGADDNQDGSVAAEGLHWRSDRDGELGSGAELPVLLSVGTHVLTLEAQNSVGLTATASTTAIIQGDYDYDGIGDDEELNDGLNPLTEMDAYSDADGDGLPLITERERDLDPDDPDSDGDGRSDADEIVDGTDPLTDDEPLPPDALAASPDDLTFEADLSLDTPLPQQLVQVSSRSPATWTLTADVDWLAASAASGQTPAGLTVLVSAYRLDDGLHTAHLTFSGNEPGGSAITPTTVTVTMNVTNSLSHFDVNLDGYVNIQDVQEVDERVGSDNSQEDFSYRHDVDRDGDVDATDWQLIWDAVFRFKVYLPIIVR